MKSIYRILLSALLIFTLCACEKTTISQNSESPDVPAAGSSTAVDSPQASNDYCATAIAKGFADNIKVSVCVDAQGEIVSVTSENHETAGLGARAVEEMGEAMMRENSEFVDAVSGATISSSAFRRAAGEAYMVAYAKSQGMVCSDPNHPMIGVWRWDSNDADFERAFWLIYPNGLFVPYSVERNENMVSLRDVHQDERNVIYHDSTLSLVHGDDVTGSLPIEWIDRDHFSLPGEGEFYYSATRVQIDSDISIDAFPFSGNDRENHQSISNSQPELPVNSNEEGGYFTDILQWNDIIVNERAYFADALLDKEYTYECALTYYEKSRMYNEANVDLLHQVDRLDDVLYLPAYSDGDIPRQRSSNVYIVPPNSTNTFNLEFREIHSGMDSKSLYKALGFSDLGIAYADATQMSEFWISDNGCYGAIDVSEFVWAETLELTNDKMIVLSYENSGFVSFLLRDDYLYSVQLCKSTYRY